MFFSLLISFFSKKNILTCGIWAWSGSSTTLFNPDKFNILGMFNDSRGGDASGKFMDRKLLKGIDKDAKFANLIKKYPTTIVRENTVAIGHARKASIGAKTAENAQPFTIYKDDKCIGVFMHNGTVTNIKELCEKYKFEYNPSLSDSYHLGYLILTEGNKILSEYIGSVACMWIKWNNRNRLYAFKGESKYTKWATIMTEDRPLYIYQEDKKEGTSLWLSSMAESLESAFQIGEKDENQVLTLKANTIYCAEKGKLYIIEQIDRTNAVEDKVYNATTNITAWETYKHKSWLSEDESIVSNKITFYRGRYHINGMLANGFYTLSNMGYLDDKGKKLYFVHGVLVRDKEAYREAISGTKTYPYKEFCKDILPFTDSVVSDYPEEDKQLSGWGRQYDNTDTDSNNNGTCFFNGIFRPFFSAKSYHFHHSGDLKDITWGDYNSYNKVFPTDDEVNEKSTELTSDYIEDLCETELDKVLTSIQKSIKNLEDIKVYPEIVVKYVDLLEKMEDSLYSELIEDFKNVEKDEK